MAQHDYIIENQSGFAFRTDLNNALAAIVSQNSGNDEPSTTYAYMLWAEQDTGLLKIRNAANSGWVTIGTMADTNLGLATLASPTFTGTVAIPTLSVTTTESIPRGALGSLPFRFSVDTNTGLYSPAEDEIAVVTGGTERVSFDSSASTFTGSVYIDATTLVTPSRIQIGNFSLTGATAGLRINNSGVIQTSVATASNAIHYQFYNPNGVVGSITTNGSATAFNTSSDYRLKENIVPLTGAADRLNQLQVHRFNFIADPDKTFDGFLAHEAQAIVPECVTGVKDEVDADGNPVYQGIDQSKLVPLLTAALQEALDRIADLEACVAVAGLTTPTNN